MEDNDTLRLGEKIIAYCQEFSIPIDFLFNILEDQKVTPMIRGKPMEYNAYIMLDKILPKKVWSVQKLNLNPQPGTDDEDISITHRKTGLRLKVENKSAVRDSMRDGRRAKIIKEPHFRVKCHRSRSNIKLAGTSNDRYSVDAFDLILTNPLNSIYKGNTISEHLEIIDDECMISILNKYYRVDNNVALLQKCQSDWRFCIPEDIAIEGFIERTPYVKLNNDPNWRPMKELEKRLMETLNKKRKNN